VATSPWRNSVIDRAWPASSAVRSSRAAAGSGDGERTAREPLSADARADAWCHYAEALEFDSLARIGPQGRLYTSMGVDYEKARRFRDGFSGKLSDAELKELVGTSIEGFRRSSNHSTPSGSTEWRQLAQVLCLACYEGSAREDERNEGDFSGQPKHSVLVTDVPEPDSMPVSLTGLLDRYLKEGETDGKPSSTRKRWTPVFADLRKHLERDDAHGLAARDVRDWLDARSETLAPKTLNDVYFAALRAAMRWVLTRKDITTDPTPEVKRRKGKRVRAVKRASPTRKRRKFSRPRSCMSRRPMRGAMCGSFRR
jgi:hypothetical protein